MGKLSRQRLDHPGRGPYRYRIARDFIQSSSVEGAINNNNNSNNRDIRLLLWVLVYVGYSYV